jgi:hypothetical protein
MTTKEIADRLVALNREGKHMEIYEELYSPDVLSIENWGDRMEFKGFDAIKQKGEMWYSSIEEMHETRVSEPLVADNSFSVTFYMDITYKPGTEMGMEGRQQMTELAVYQVKDGKIFHEEFFG